MPWLPQGTERTHGPAVRRAVSGRALRSGTAAVPAFSRATQQQLPSQSVLHLQWCFRTAGAEESDAARTPPPQAQRDSANSPASQQGPRRVPIREGGAEYQCTGPGSPGRPRIIPAHPCRRPSWWRSPPGSSLGQDDCKARRAARPAARPDSSTGVGKPTATCPLARRGLGGRATQNRVPHALRRSPYMSSPPWSRGSRGRPTAGTLV